MGPGPLACLFGMALVQNIPRTSASRCLVCYLQQQQATVMGFQQARPLPTTRDRTGARKLHAGSANAILPKALLQQVKQRRAATNDVLERA